MSFGTCFRREGRRVFDRLVSAPGDAWNLPSEGTGVGGFPAGRPAEGAGALVLAQFKIYTSGVAFSETALGCQPWMSTAL